MSKEYIYSKKDGSIQKTICTDCGIVVASTDIRCPNCGAIWVCDICGYEFSNTEYNCPNCPPSLNNFVKPSKTFLGSLNSNGVFMFFVLLFTITPLCWLPWVIPSLKKEPLKIKKVLRKK